MAAKNVRLKLSFRWLLAVCLVEHTVVVVCLEANFSSPEEESFLSLRNCCTNRDNYSISSENCPDLVNISWNILQVYRVPNSAATNIQIQTDLKPTLNSQLKCENQLQISIPPWSPHEGTLDPKAFSAFFSDDGHFQALKHVYAPQDYCIERITSEEIRVLACKQPSCNAINNSRPCLSRCCNYGEVWDIQGKLRCRASGKHKWTPREYEAINSEELFTPNDDIGTQRALRLVSSHPRDLLHQNVCGPHTFQTQRPSVHESGISTFAGNRPFKVLKDGTVWLKVRKQEWVKLNRGEYCVDGFQFGEGNYSGNNEDSLLFECKIYETEEEVEGKERQRTYSITFGGILIFCLCFLLVTIIVYALLWSKHNIHGWTVFSYIVAMFLTYLMLGIKHIASVTEVRKGGTRQGIWTFCGITGILCHFAFLSTFSWSTVLNFDLWCTFRCLKPTSRKSSGLKKFVFVYCLFAFTLPCLVVALGVGFDITYRNDVYNDVITPPGYGRVVCFVEPRHARLYYVLLPMSVLLGINLLLFGKTAYAVFVLKRSTQFATSSSTKKESKYHTFRLILKLFLMNGIVWLTDVLSWYFQKSYEEVGILSFLLNVIIVLQAVAIFFLFVFKNDILDGLRKKYPSLKGLINWAFKIKNYTCTRKRGGRASNDTVAASTDHNTKADKNTSVGLSLIQHSSAGVNCSS